MGKKKLKLKLVLTPNGKKQKRNCPNPIWQNIKLSLLVSFISFKRIDQSETQTCSVVSHNLKQNIMQGFMLRTTYLALGHL